MLSIETINVDTYDLDEVEVGTQFQAGTNVVTYVGEFELQSIVADGDEDSHYAFTYNGDEFGIDSFERTGGVWGSYSNFVWFDGVLFGTYDSGRLVKLTSDGEGVYLFTF